MGGPGGAGSNENNVEVAVAVVRPDQDESPADIKLDELFGLHPNFRTLRSLVLHRQGVDPAYHEWRREVRSFSCGKVSLTLAQRHTPALFGAGLIDSLSDETIRQGVKTWHPGFPKVRGRVSRTADGAIGRFGWKAQTASLDDFVRTACAVEMGLEVPGHAQAINPRTPDVPAPGLDLSEAECDALTAFVASLPRPMRRPAWDRAAATTMAEGERLFATIGCATCHTPKLGAIEGLYSDLLLHDLGPSLASLATYYSTPAPESTAEREMATLADPAGPNDWRTPPLWGLRDSGPYLHDGRARTIDEAVHWHGGEAQDSSDLYGKLNKQERKALQSFLMSLAAPVKGKLTTTATR
jgi:CxxC motif-containing protein (DUF1111 family)